MSTETDPYAAARDKTREALRFYVSCLVGLGAVLAGGLSFAILPDLSGTLLWAAVGFGAVAIGTIVYGVWTVHDILAPHPFDPASLTDPAFRARLAPYLPALMPIDAPTPEAVERKLAALAGRDQTAETVKDIDRLTVERTKLMGFAAALQLDAVAVPAKRRLLGVFVVALAMAAAVTVIGGIAKARLNGGEPVVLWMRGGWAGYVDAVSAACPMPHPDGLAATGKPGAPFSTAGGP